MDEITIKEAVDLAIREKREDVFNVPVSEDPMKGQTPVIQTRDGKRYRLKEESKWPWTDFDKTFYPIGDGFYSPVYQAIISAKLRRMARRFAEKAMKRNDGLQAEAADDSTQLIMDSVPIATVQLESSATESEINSFMMTKLTKCDKRLRERFGLWLSFHQRLKQVPDMIAFVKDCQKERS